jgi:PAS domain S-box-containing protein
MPLDLGPREGGHNRVLELTNRELDILKLAAEGKTDKAIANALGLSVDTVKSYWHRLRSRLGVSSRTQLIAAFAQADANKVVRQITKENQMLLFEIAERRRTELLLQEAEQRYRSLVERIPAILYRESLDGQSLLYISPQVEEMLGYTCEALQLQPELASEIIYEEDKERVAAERRRCYASLLPFEMEYRVVSADGPVLWIQASSFPIYDEESQPLYYQGIITDITAQKQAEAKLKEAEERWRTLIECAPDFIVTTSRDFRILTINRTIPGLSIEQVIGTSLLDYVPRDHHKTMTSAIHRAFQEGTSVMYEVAGEGPNGQPAWYVSRVSPIIHNGKAEEAVIISSDITDRHRTREAILESERNLAALVEAAFEAIFIHQEGRIVVANQTFAALFGYGLGEVVGMAATEFAAPESRELIQSMLQKDSLEPYRARGLRKDSSTFWGEVRSKSITYKGRPARAVAIRTLSETYEPHS